MKGNQDQLDVNQEITLFVHAEKHLAGPRFQKFLHQERDDGTTEMLKTAYGFDPGEFFVEGAGDLFGKGGLDRMDHLRVQRIFIAIDDFNPVHQDTLRADETLVMLDDMARDNELEGFEKVFDGEVFFPANEGDTGQPLVLGLEVLDFDAVVRLPFANEFLKPVIVKDEFGQIRYFPLFEVFARSGREEF